MKRSTIIDILWILSIIALIGIVSAIWRYS